MHKCIGFQLCEHERQMKKSFLLFTDNNLLDVVDGVPRTYVQYVVKYIPHVSYDTHTEFTLRVLESWRLSLYEYVYTFTYDADIHRK